jgi:hypothetical protein
MKLTNTLTAYALGIASAYVIDRAARRALAAHDMEADRLEAERAWTNQEEGEAVIRERRADWSGYQTVRGTEDQTFMAPTSPIRRGGIAHLGMSQEELEAQDRERDAAATHPLGACDVCASSRLFM